MIITVRAIPAISLFLESHPDFFGSGNGCSITVLMCHLTRKEIDISLLNLCINFDAVNWIQSLYSINCLSQHKNYGYKWVNFSDSEEQNEKDRSKAV